MGYHPTKPPTDDIVGVNHGQDQAEQHVDAEHDVHEEKKKSHVRTREGLRAMGADKVYETGVEYFLTTVIYLSATYWQHDVRKIRRGEQNEEVLEGMPQRLEVV